MIDATAQQIIATADPDAIIYDTLEFDHPLFNLAIVAGFAPLTAGGKTYQPYAFDVAPSAVADGENNELEATISNVRRSIPTLIIQALESTDPVKLYHRQVITNSAGTMLSIIQPDLSYQVTSCAENKDSVSISAAFVNILDALFLNQRYDATRFPGLI